MLGTLFSIAEQTGPLKTNPYMSRCDPFGIAKQIG